MLTHCCHPRPKHLLPIPILFNYLKRPDLASFLPAEGAQLESRPTL